MHGTLRAISQSYFSVFKKISVFVHLIDLICNYIWVLNLFYPLETTEKEEHFMNVLNRLVLTVLEGSS